MTEKKIGSYLKNIIDAIGTVQVALGSKITEDQDEAVSRLIGTIIDSLRGSAADLQEALEGVDEVEEALARPRKRPVVAKRSVVDELKSQAEEAEEPEESQGEEPDDLGTQAVAAILALYDAEVALSGAIEDVSKAEHAYRHAAPGAKRQLGAARDAAYAKVISASDAKAEADAMMKFIVEARG